MKQINANDEMTASVSPFFIIGIQECRFRTTMLQYRFRQRCLKIVLSNKKEMSDFFFIGRIFSCLDSAKRFFYVMPRRLRFALAAAFIAAMMPALPAQNTDTNKVELTKDPAELAKGEKLFVTHCAVCHGPNGEGAKGPTLAQPALP